MFTGERITISRNIRVEATADIVHSLLCPEREKEWIDGWSYEMIYSQSGFAEHGCVWKTNFPEEGEAIWIMVRNTPSHEAIYIKYVPDVMIGELSFVLTNPESNVTSIDVKYTFTGLTEKGNKFIDTILSGSLEQKLLGLEGALDYYLRTGNVLRKR